MLSKDFPMQLATIRDKLVEYGIDELEADMYLRLAVNGPMTVNNLAYSSGLYKMKVYRALKKLVDLDLVETTLSRPTLYSAVPARKAISLILDDVYERLEKVRQDSAFVIESIMNLSRSRRDPIPPSRFRIVQGREQTFRLIKRMIRNSKIEVNNINTGNGIIRCVKLGLDQHLEECAKRGVRARWLTEASGVNAAEIRRLSEVGQVRHVHIPDSIRFIVVDGSETLLSSVDDDSTDVNTLGEATFWTNDASISRLMNQLFGVLWRSSARVK